MQLQQNQRLPFRTNTRKRVQPFATRTFAVSTTIDAPEIPKVGLLSKVFITVTGTATISGAALVNNGWNLLKRIKISLNQGADNLVDVTGYGAQLVQGVINKGFLINNAGAGSTTVDTDLYSLPVAGGAGTAFTITYEIPIAANAGDEFELGLLNLQATDLRARVQIDTGAAADIASGWSAVVGTIYYSYEYYEIPDSAQVQLPSPNVVIRTLEETTQLTTAGANIYEVPRQGGLLQLIHTIRPNATLNNADVVSFQLKFNKSNTILDLTKTLMKLNARKLYGINFPTGTFIHDFFCAAERPNTGLMRDVVDTEQITTTESIINLTSTVTFGSNNNTVDTVRRIIQMLK